MPWWAEPQRHTVVVVCACPSVCLYFQVMFLHNARKLSAETCFASKTHNSLEKIWDFYRLMVWCAHLDGCCRHSSPEKNKFLHSRLLFNTTVQFVQQIRRRPERTRLPKLHSLTPWTACNWRHSLIWHTPMPDWSPNDLHSNFLLQFFVYTNRYVAALLW